MWESLLFSANIVLPSFILILVGRCITRFGLMRREEMDKISKLTFKYVLSVKIFSDIAANDASTFSNVRMVAYILAMLVALFLVIWFLAARMLKKKESVGSFVQSCFRCSFTVLGLSMIDSFAGSEGVARCALLLATAAITINILASIVLTPRGEQADRRARTLKTLKGIATNPLIIASVLGLLFSFAGWRLPGVLNKAVRNYGAMAAPLSLLCIGASLSLDRIRGSFKYAFIASCVKTFGEAAVAIPVAIALGFTGFELTVIAIFFTAANPAANYVMALACGGDSDLAATGLVISTMMCVFTTMAAITIIRALGYA